MPDSSTRQDLRKKAPIPLGRRVVEIQTTLEGLQGEMKSLQITLQQLRRDVAVMGRDVALYAIIASFIVAGASTSKFTEPPPSIALPSIEELEDPDVKAQPNV